MDFRIHRLMNDLLTRGIFPNEIVTMPIGLGSNWPWNETAAAIRANILKNVFHAFLAEGAFESADHSICGFRWK